MLISLTTDHAAARLRVAACASKNANQTRRLLALASIYDGATCTEAPAIGGVTVQIVRDWVVKLNAHGPEGLIDRKGGGTASILTDEHCVAMAMAIEDGPIPAIHGVVLARRRPMPMAVGQLRARDFQADAEPRAAEDGVSPAVGPAAPPCPGGRCYRGF